MFLKLTRLLSQGCINLPISSKYYHSQLPSHLPKIISMIQSEPQFNEKAHLIEHLTHTLLKDPKNNLTYDQKKTLNIQFAHWNGLKSRQYNIASVLWSLKKLKLNDKNRQLEAQLVTCLQNDEWYVNFDQSLKALQAIVDLPDSPQKDEIFQRVERNIGITVWEQNMTKYERIVTSLYQAGRYQSPLWDKLEEHILKNLSMPYTTRTLCNIFKAYALSRNGHEMFYLMCQKVIYNGHLQANAFRMGHKFEFDATGEFFALLIETYGEVVRNTDLRLSVDFKHYLYRSIGDARVPFTQLSSLTKIIAHIEHLGYHPEDQKAIITRLIQQSRNAYIDKPSDIEQLYASALKKFGHLPPQISEIGFSAAQKAIQSRFYSLPDNIKLASYLEAVHSAEQLEPIWKALETDMKQRYKYLTGKEAKEVSAKLKLLGPSSSIVTKLIPGKNQQDAQINHNLKAQV